MRKEFCKKDGILITYMEDNICFEELATADSILIANDGQILFNNFSQDSEKTAYFVAYFHKIYDAVAMLRSMDSIEEAS